MKVRTLPVVFILALTLSGRDLAAAVEPVRNESKRVDIADIADCMPAVDRGDVLTFRGLAGKEACRLYIQASFGGSGSLSPSRPDIPRAPNPPSSGNIMTPEECYKRFEAGEAIHYAGRTGRDACDFYLQYSMNQAQLSLQQEQLRQQQRFHNEQLRLQQQQKEELADAVYRRELGELFQQHDQDRQHQENLRQQENLQRQQQHQQYLEQNRRLNCTTRYRGSIAYTDCQ